jgi:hypothetical protein
VLGLIFVQFELTVYQGMILRGAALISPLLGVGLDLAHEPIESLS